MRWTGILAVDLTALGERQYSFATANRLWLPKRVVLNGKLYVNPLDAVLAVRIGDRTDDAHPWAIADGFMNSVSGDLSSIFVTVLTQGLSSQMFFATGQGVAASYGSTDGLSPIVGAGSGGADTPNPNTPPALRGPGAGAVVTVHTQPVSGGVTVSGLTIVSGGAGYVAQYAEIMVIGHAEQLVVTLGAGGAITALSAPSSTYVWPSVPVFEVVQQ